MGSMGSRTYSFLDVAALAAVGPRLAAGDALVVLDTALSTVLWANGAGARIFGANDPISFIGTDPALRSPVRRQIEATSGFPAIGVNRGLVLRLAGGLFSRTTAFAASEIGMPDGETGILLATTPARVRPGAALDGLSGDGQFAALLDGEGSLIAAADGFSGLGIGPATLAGLMAEVRGEGDRMIKRPLRAAAGMLPAGIVLLTDAPPTALLVVVDEAEEPAGEEAAATAEPEAQGGPTPTQVAAPLLEIAPAGEDVETAAERAQVEGEAEAAPLAGLPHGEEMAEAGAAAPAEADAIDAAEPNQPDEVAEPVAALPQAEAPTPAPPRAGQPEADDRWYFSGVRTDDGAAPQATTTHDQPAGMQLAADLSALPVRFVWRTDVDGRFTAISDEFRQAFGEGAADVIGRSFGDVAQVFGLDPGGEIAGLLARRDTWSGRAVLWPVAGTDLRVPVDLAALPVYGRDRAFEGFRGFGVARMGDAVIDPEAIGLALGAPSGAMPDEDGDATPVEQRGGEPHAPFGIDRPAIVAAPPPEPPRAEKVIVLSERRPGPPRDLSAAEQNNFREIGERLRGSGLAGTDAAETDPQTAMEPPAEQPVTARPVGTGSVAGEPHDTITAADAALTEILATELVAGTVGALEAGEPARDVAPQSAAEFLEPPIGREEERRSEQAIDLGAFAAASYDRTSGGVPGDVEPSDKAAAKEPGNPVYEPSGDGLAGEAPVEALSSADELLAGHDRPAGAAMELPGASLLEADTDTTATAPLEAIGNSEPVEPVMPLREQPAEGLASDLAEPADEPTAAEIADLSLLDDIAAAEDAPQADAEEMPEEAAALRAFEAADDHDAAEIADLARLDDMAAEEATPPADAVNMAEEAVLGVADDDAPLAVLALADTPLVAGPEFAEPVSDTVREAEPMPPVPEPETAPDEHAGTLADEAQPRAQPAALAMTGENPDTDAAAAHEPPADGRDDAPAADEKPDGAPDETLDGTDIPAVSGVETAVFARLPLPILIHRGDALYFANREFLDVTGYGSLEDLDAAGGLGALFGDPYREGGDSKLRLRRRDGAELPVDAFLQSVAWQGGKALLLSLRVSAEPQPPAHDAPAHDVPGHEAVEARLEELRTIIDTATDGVVLIENDGTIRSISRPAEALFGYEAADLRGKPFSGLFAMESQRAARDYLAGLADNGVASVLNDGREVIGREAQGRFVPLFMTIGRLPHKGGYCAVVRDITQFKRAEEELTQARSQAERASSQKTDFLARVSHEIRTPLNAIIGFSELMLDEKFGPITNERYKDYLRDINRSGNHVLDLVNDLLDISKIEAGQLELNYEAVSLNEALAEAVAMMQPQANRERVIIRSSFASRLPDVVADLRSVKQIALNLLSNAIRYTPAGGQVIVSTSYEPAGDILMRVRDTGIGMAAAEIEQALKPFKQINALKRPRGDGTGLGLPLTKAMVEANRARFAIQSTPGEGTLVEITFPSTRVLAH
jgi:PAS domain S-box-containing protein